ncbi:MAG: BrnT family toxin [Treponema sp.]
MKRNTDFIYLDTFVWDTEKNEANKKKHRGLSFELASRVFNDPLLYNAYDYVHSDDEYREKFIGKIEGHYVVSVIAADRGNLIRLISARKADKTEVRLYEENAKRIQGY